MTACTRGALRAPTVRITACCAAIVAGCANPMVRERTGEVISPYATTQACVDVKAGERIDYRFQSDTPLRYAVVSRDGDAEVASVSEEGVMEDSRIFAPALPREYCLTFEAGPAGAKIDYTLSVRPPAP
jgi:hypothetical protein